ncbi:MAG: serine hydrolase [Terracidiphilus sp.]|nr:serine hydrolase [Terracidiphilus sp.]
MIRRPRHIAILFLILALTVPAASAQSIPLEQFKSMAAEAMQQQTLPGISVAVWQHGKLEAFALGYADVEGKVPATPQTLYRLASISKPITAVAVLELAKQHKLDLDAPAEKYCPAFPAHPEVTARELLSHRSGVPHYKNDAAAENTRHFNSLDDAVKNFAAEPLVFPAGSGFHYTSYGFTVLGCEIEGASGESYESYVREHLFHPLHMSAQVDDAHIEAEAHLHFYSLKNGKLVMAHPLDTSDRLPGGGWLSTPTELVRFAAGVRALLGEEWSRRMWTDTAKPGEKEHYGMGWFLLKLGPHDAVAHSGGQLGTSTYLLEIPSRDTAIAVFTNRDGADMGKVARKMAERME